ncbi:MAG: hypothetical protein RSE13_03900 [Planktothrix sp. GU0601_MAG3]|nr:MAG: hypothetical protein RSE13_03900 [Planktothrix sp. GU0601_MAG3]
MRPLSLRPSINYLPREQFKLNLKLLILLWQFFRLQHIQVYSQLFASLILAVQINCVLTAVSRPLLAQIPESLPSERFYCPNSSSTWTPRTPTS